MSKKKRRSGKTVTAKKPAPAPAPAASKAKRKKFSWVTVAIVLVLGSLSYVGFAAYKQNWNEMHDLSAIGNGIPTVVQVHDPNCALCRSLKKNTQKAIDRVGGDIQYRIAGLHTPAGRDFAARYSVGKVTLLTFDGSGKFLNQYQGVKEVATLERLLTPVATPR